MCGLAGFFKGQIFSSSENVYSCLKNMTDAIQHRGPDSEGFWYQTDDKIALGHRRLSILDLSEAGHQPMLSDDGRYVIAFNGEIYNHLEIREEIDKISPDIDWKGHSDTETLLKAIQLFGWEDSLKKLIGMFAIALWDNLNKSLFLGRDRFGEKPLYYGWQKDSFLFGSELKALTIYPTFEKKIDKKAISLLLKHGYISSPYSIWQNIFKLPSAHYLQLNEKNVEPSLVCYWSFKDSVEQAEKSKLNISDDEAIDQYEEFLSKSINRQMISDVPLGALLSGGIDSSLVVALMQKSSQQPVKTFSIGFDNPKFDESKHAEAVAAHLGTEHTTLIMKPSDLLELVPHIAKIYDEPFADSSQLPTTIVSRLAKQHVTVALSGDAGDEILAGYNRYYLVLKIWNNLQKMPPLVRKNIGKLLTLLTPEQLNACFGWIFKGMKQPYLGDKLYKLGERLKKVSSIEELYLAYLTECNEPEGLLKDFSEQFYYNLGNIEDWPNISNPIEKMMAIDSLSYLVDDILVKVDRAAMSTSLELRAPFLDHNIVEYVWSLPFNFKYRQGKAKWLSRQVLYKYVPERLIDRPKQGFGIPINDWLRGPLKTWADDLLNISFLEKQDLFDSIKVQQIWQQHLSGNRQYGARLWSILMFQAWYKENFYEI